MIDTTSPRMTYAETLDLFVKHTGQRIRLTYPNGVHRVGVCGWRLRWANEPNSERMAMLDGNWLGGELEGAVKFEVMGDNGRYSVAQ